LEPSKWSCRTEWHRRWWRLKTKKVQTCSRCKSKTTPKSRESMEPNKVVNLP
jgi:hypothetical protein